MGYIGINPKLWMVHVHIQQTGHNTTDTSFSITGREDQGLARTIKESIYIRVNSPALSKNICKYNLSHVYGTESFLTPQGLNWALPNGQVHKHNLESMSQPNIVSNSHVHKHNLGSMPIYPIINVLQQP